MYFLTDFKHFVLIFDPNGSLVYASSRSDWPPLSAENISLSLSHIVPEMLEPNFVSSFSLIFNPTDPLFHWS